MTGLVAGSSPGELSFADIGKFVSAQRLPILVAGAVGLFGGIAYAMLASPVYRADVVVLPSLDQQSAAGGLSQMSGQLGGLASLAGLSLGGDDKREEALQILKSRRLTAQFIERNDLMPVLFANKWDSRAGRWSVRDVDDVPTIARGVERFDQDVRQIGEDRRTGIVTVSIEWSDREQAAKWANDLVAMADSTLRERAVAEAQRNLDYMRAQLEKTEIVEVREAVYRIMESQLKAIMLAQSRKEFAFRILDPATAPDPDQIARPKRAMVIVAGLIGGLLLGVLLGLVRSIFSMRRARRGIDGNA